MKYENDIIGHGDEPLTPKPSESEKNMKIFVTFQKEAIHCYPDAPTGVEFLKHPHRHMFHFRVEIEVFHNDRDREFILEKRWMESLYNGILGLDYKSCEMIAEDLHLKLVERYKGENRRITIEVSEDGENGCIIQFPAT